MPRIVCKKVKVQNKKAEINSELKLNQTAPSEVFILVCEGSNCHGAPFKLEIHQLVYGPESTPILKFLVISLI